MLDEKLKIKSNLDAHRTKEYFIGIYTRLGKYKTPPTWHEVQDKSYIEAMLLESIDVANQQHQQKKGAYYGKSKRATGTF